MFFVAKTCHCKLDRWKYLRSNLEAFSDNQMDAKHAESLPSR